jgi:hypothetical protein
MIVVVMAFTSGESRKANVRAGVRRLHSCCGIIARFGSSTLSGLHHSSRVVVQIHGTKRY